MPNLKEIADQTPPGRERYMDFLRAFSILSVVLGHWFIAIIYWNNQRIGVGNVIGNVRGLWAATWVFQVIPLFFFVGGFANAKTLAGFQRRGEPIGLFLRTRLARLLRPTAVFLAVWLPIQLVLHIIDIGGNRLIRGGIVPFAPLWFLLVYLGVVLLSPVMLKLHQRFRLWVPLALIAVAAIVDLAAFGADIHRLRWVNLGAIWLFAHQLGFFYADGSLPAIPRFKHLAGAVGGLAALVVLTNSGVYPGSMIGNHADRVSNMNPPTLCIIALTIWQVSLAMVLRPPLTRWLQRPKPWVAVIAANASIMTIYLWHMTAYTIVTLIAYPLGFGRTAGDSTWWWQRPLWTIGPALVLVLLVRIFMRFEQGPLQASR